MFKDISLGIASLLQRVGVNPVYFFSVLVIIIHVIFDRKKYKHWDILPRTQRFFFITSSFIVLVFVIISALTFMGITVIR